MANEVASKQRMLPSGTYRTLREVVLDNLRSAILRGELAPGQRIFEMQIAAEMGTSRAPAREALRELEAEGLVESHANRGTYVATFNERDIIEIFAIRETLETLAVEWIVERRAAFHLRAMEQLVLQMEHLIEDSKNQAHDEVFNVGSYVRLDHAFHRELIAAAESNRLSALLDMLYAHVNVVMVVGSGTFDLKRIDQTVAEHRGILAALAHGDITVAQRLLREHLSTARQRILLALKRDPPIGSEVEEMLNVRGVG